MVYRYGNQKQASESTFIANNPNSTKLLSPRLTVADFRLILSAVYSIRHDRDVFLTRQDCERLDKLLVHIQDTLEEG